MWGKADEDRVELSDDDIFEEGLERPEVNLRVDEARQRDVGRTIIRLDNKTMNLLNIRTGDITELEGKKVSAAIAWPAYPQDQNLDIIRIDARLRRNLGVELGEKVIVRKARIKVAKSIVLAPASITIRTDSRFEGFVKRKLLNYPFTVDDEIYISIGISREIMFKVISIRPEGICVVKQQTILHINEKPIGEFDKSIIFTTFEDVGGLNDVIIQIKETIELSLRHPEILREVGVEPIKGLLLIGPPGSGKTLLVKALSNESEAHFIAFNGTEIMSKYYGESEKRLRQYFIEAEEHWPSIIYIDQIDALAPRRTFIDATERRVVAQLLSLMDGLRSRQVFVIGETNQPEWLDPALRRPGRFDLEIVIPSPSEQGRQEIFAICARRMKLANEVDFADLAAKTLGFLGADIAEICRRAGMIAIKRFEPALDLEAEVIDPKVIASIIVTSADFDLALEEFSAMKRLQAFSQEQSDLANAQGLLTELLTDTSAEINLTDICRETPTLVSLVEVLLQKHSLTKVTPEEGRTYATKHPGVFFCERPDGTYWLVSRESSEPDGNEEV